MLSGGRWTARGTSWTRTRARAGGLSPKRTRCPEAGILSVPIRQGNSGVLIWHNRNKGLVAYWRINADGRLLGVDDSGWGLVSSEMRVGSNWELSDISRVGEHEVLFWKNLVNGMVAFWRLNSDDTLLDTFAGQRLGLCGRRRRPLQGLGTRGGGGYRFP